MLEEDSQASPRHLLVENRVHGRTPESAPQGITIGASRQNHPILAVNLSAEPWTWPEEGLAQDVLEIIPVFSARLDASRSRKTQPLLEEPNGEAELCVA